ncbi:MAG: STE24 endopeptidase [Glaciecola sp.]|jgi:STE24 endopeptidase
MTEPAAGAQAPSPLALGGRFWAAAAILLALVGFAANVLRPLAPAVSAIPVPQERFDPALLAAIAEYREPRLLAALVSLAITVLVPVLVLVLPRGRALVRRLADVRVAKGPMWLHDPVRGAIVGALVLILTRIAGLPISFWIGHVQERAWGFRIAAGAAWFGDWAVAVAVETVVIAVVGALFVVLVRRWPRDWHWRVVVAATLLSAALVLLAPLLIQPLTLSSTPLPAGPLRDRLEAVVAESGIQARLTVGDASRRTTKVNAFVTGLGPTRQVVLWDTLLRLPADEVVAVVAHELAHRDHQDIPRGIALTAMGVLPFALVLRRVLASPRISRTLGTSRAGDPRQVAVLVAASALAQILVLPPALIASRRAEAAADHRALIVTQDPDALISTFRGFVARDLSSPSPSLLVTLLFASHPSADLRIRAVVQEARRRGWLVSDLASFEAEELQERHPRAGQP